MNTDVMFSSKSAEWSTPQDLFDKLDEEFNFTLDVCATPENAKCAEYYTKDDDGLNRAWYPKRPGAVWCNPPYGRGIGEWVEQGYYAAADQRQTVVMLLPARTDTKWWHEYVIPHAYEVRFLKGRLKFGGHKNSAPFPSAVVVFRPEAK